jgi:hypothetical protein
MQRGPPRPRPSSGAGIVTTSMPAWHRRAWCRRCARKRRRRRARSGACCCSRRTARARPRSGRCRSRKATRPAARGSHAHRRPPLGHGHRNHAGTERAGGSALDRGGSGPFAHADQHAAVADDDDVAATGRLGHGLHRDLVEDPGRRVARPGATPRYGQGNLPSPGGAPQGRARRRWRRRPHRRRAAVRAM